MAPVPDLALRLQKTGQYCDHRLVHPRGKSNTPATLPMAMVAHTLATDTLPGAGVIGAIAFLKIDWLTGTFFHAASLLAAVLKISRFKIWCAVRTLYQSCSQKKIFVRADLGVALNEGAHARCAPTTAISCSYTATSHYTAGEMPPHDYLVIQPPRRRPGAGPQGSGPEARRNSSH